MRKIIRILSTFILKILFIELKITSGKNLNAVGLPIIDKAKGSSITIGNNLVICSKDFSNPLGLNHKTIIRTIDENSKIKIGNDVGISGASICASNDIYIGDNVMLGANVQISDTDFHAIKPLNRRHNRNKEDVQTKSIMIENNVWIGANSIILKGVKIGENSIIGAGSIVTNNVPANSIAAGNPAKIIKTIV